MSDPLPPDLSELTPEQLARILVDRGALAGGEAAGGTTTTTQALGGLCGVGFDTQPQPDAVIEPDAQDKL